MSGHADIGICRGNFSLSVVNAKYVAKIGRRSEPQNPDTVRQIVMGIKWGSFNEVKDYRASGDAEQIHKGF